MFSYANLSPVSKLFARQGIKNVLFKEITFLWQTGWFKHISLRLLMH